MSVTHKQQTLKARVSSLTPKGSVSSLTPHQQTLKDRTPLATNIVSRLSDESAQKMNEAIQNGMNPNEVADLVEAMFIHHEKKKYSEIYEKIKQEIEKGDEAKYNHIVERSGKEFIYKKCVQIDDQMYPIETKVCQSERQCRAWLRLKKISAEFK